MAAGGRKWRHLAKGMATMLPPLESLRRRHAHTGGTVSAHYCYTVWLTHLVLAHSSGLSSDPRTVGELGPGDSIGTGLAALLSGASRYYALDVVRHADPQLNLAIFDQLVELYRERAPLGAHADFPDLWPRLDDRSFPRHLLGDDRLEQNLRPARLDEIRRAIENCDSPDGPMRYTDGAVRSTDGAVSYVVPWTDQATAAPASLDCVISQAALEHVDGVDLVYAAMHRWLRTGGWCSHTIDFRSHGYADAWNGHWTYSDLEWRLVRGGRPYLLNRCSHSQHLAAARRQGFEVTLDLPRWGPDGVGRHRLAPSLAPVLTDDDLHCQVSFLQLRKPG